LSLESLLHALAMTRFVPDEDGLIVRLPGRDQVIDDPGKFVSGSGDRHGSSVDTAGTDVDTCRISPDRSRALASRFPSGALGSHMGLQLKTPESGPGRATCESPKRDRAAVCLTSPLIKTQAN
jgi:hypothetical protein